MIRWFEQLVLARVIEPTSKADIIRVLSEVGVERVPALRTVWRTLRRCVDRDWRGQLAAAAHRHAITAGPLKLVLYDCTTLYFEAENEDEFRKVGMSKERPESLPPTTTCFRSNGRSGWPRPTCVPGRSFTTPATPSRRT